MVTPQTLIGASIRSRTEVALCFHFQEDGACLFDRRASLAKKHLELFSQRQRFRLINAG